MSFVSQETFYCGTLLTRWNTSIIIVGVLCARVANFLKGQRTVMKPFKFMHYFTDIQNVIIQVNKKYTSG